MLNNNNNNNNTNEETAANRLDEQLKTLLDFTAIINSTLDIEDLMNIVMEKAKTELQAEACSILFFNKNTNKLEFEIAICNDEETCETLKEKIYIELGQGIAGWTALHQKPLYIEDVEADERFFKGVDKTTGFVTKSIISMPLIGRRGLIGVAEIINPARADYDRDIFGALCKQFAIAIENALLYKESLDRERIKQEMEIAASIQKSFLPDSPIFTKGEFYARAVNIPAYAIGGDIYDFVDISEDKAGVFIGDISGKGISAALYMAKIISDFRHISLINKSVAGAMNALNLIIGNAPRGMFLTAIYMTIDMHNGIIDFINAGHPPFIHLSKKGEARVVSESSGPPLGMLMDSYSPVSFRLDRGERVILLTDGVTDARDPNGSYLGFDNVVSFVRQHISSKNLIDILSEYVSGYSEGHQRADDITIVEIGRK